jgi:hypothetical protein
LAHQNDGVRRGDEVVSGTVGRSPFQGTREEGRLSQKREKEKKWYF